jgi:thiol-disulfide isomerase/thioredoxin
MIRVYSFTVLIVILFSAFSISSLGNELPQIGKRCPEFELHNIKNFHLTHGRTKDFLGKWLILDFWNKVCGACIESFPRTNQLQKEFSSNVQFMLVGLQDKENQVLAMFSRIREVEDLIIPCEIDSDLAQKWDIGSCPHLIIVDPKGFVRGITNEIDSADIEQFLSGGTPTLARTYTGNESDDIVKIPFDSKYPYFINGNGGNSDTGYLFRSILSSWNPNLQGTFHPRNIDLHSLDPDYFRKGMTQILGAGLLELYYYAYFGKSSWDNSDTLMYGKYYDQAILEIGDSSRFVSSMKGEGENLFCYSLTLPIGQGSKERMEEVMQGDLKNYFGFNARIETRKCPYWRLIIESPSLIGKLRSTGSESYVKQIIPRVKYLLHNVPMKKLLYDLQMSGIGIVLDETGISGNIDFDEGDVNLKDIRNSLGKVGLDLIEGEKNMKGLVIQDR